MTDIEWNGLLNAVEGKLEAGQTKHDIVKFIWEQLSGTILGAGNIGDLAEKIYLMAEARTRDHEKQSVIHREKINLGPTLFPQTTPPFLKRDEDEIRRNDVLFSAIRQDIDNAIKRSRKRSQYKTKPSATFTFIEKYKAKGLKKTEIVSKLRKQFSLNLIQASKEYETCAKKKRRRTMTK